MKRLILFLLFPLLACSVRAAAPTISQHKSAFGNGVTSISATFTSSVTAGHMILVFAGLAQSSTLNIPTMTGETFTAWAGARNAGTLTNGQTGVWATNSAAGGQTTVTLTFTTAADVHLHIFDIAGQAPSPRDAQGNTEAVALSVTTSGATTNATDLVIGFFYDNALNQTFTAGSGYASVEQTNNTTGGDCAFSESKTVSSTGTQTATASAGGGETREQSIVAISSPGATTGCTNSIALLGVGCR